MPDVTHETADPRHAPRKVHPLSPRLALGAGVSISLALILVVDAGRLDRGSAAAFVVGLLFAGAWLWLERSFLKEVTRERHMPFGLNNAIFLVIAAALCLTVNLLAHRYTLRVPGLERWDLTRNAFFSFSPQTLSLLKTLKKPTRALAFFSDPKAKNRTASILRGQRASVKRLLELYAEMCPTFTWRMVDPEKDPMTAKRHGVRDNATVILSYGDQKTTLHEYDFFVRANPTTVVPKFKGEQAMTSALLKLSRDVNPKVYFLAGHGEATIEDRTAEGLAAMAERVRAENYRVDQLNLAAAAAIPDDCACLVVAGPRIPLDPMELAALEAYVDRGGCTLFCLDTQPLPGIAKLLKRFEILWRRNVVIDPVDCYFRRHSMPLPSFNEHAITHPLIEAGLRPIFDEATALGQTAPGGKDYHLRTIVQSSAYSWAETKLRERNVAFEADQDEMGPLILGQACTTDRSVNSQPKRLKANEYRLVVIGDSHFARNRLQGVQGNADFFLNCVNWLTGEADRVTIRPKVYQIDRARLSESWGRWIFYGCVLCLPGLIFAVGLGVYWRRRSL